MVTRRGGERKTPPISTQNPEDHPNISKDIVVKKCEQMGTETGDRRTTGIPVRSHLRTPSLHIPVVDLPRQTPSRAH